MDINDILIERGNRYGKFKDQAQISYQLKNICLVYCECLDPYHIEAIDMIMHKIARILNGDPNYIDSWQDIAGYAQLVVNILKEHGAKGTTNE